MPNFPIVDSHVHLWDPTHFRMKWLDKNELLNKPYKLEEYNTHTAGIEIGAMVYLQVDLAEAYGLLEPGWVHDLAQQDSRIQGIVPWAPVEFGDQTHAYLEALKKTSPLVKGVRRLIQSESIDFCVEPRFVRGVQILPEYDLSFDICIYHPQLANAIKLVEQCPDVRFILDHIGKPNIKDQVLDPWREQIKTLASHENVYCKVSGMVTEADRQKWMVDDLRPYVEHVLEAFGEDRVVYGGDWPVVLMGSSYRNWVETLDTITAGLSDHAKRKLWAENARDFYRLPKSS